MSTSTMSDETFQLIEEIHEKKLVGVATGCPFTRLIANQTLYTLDGQQLIDSTSNTPLFSKYQLLLLAFGYIRQNTPIKFPIEIATILRNYIFQDCYLAVKSQKVCKDSFSIFFAVKDDYIHFIKQKLNHFFTKDFTVAIEFQLAEHNCQNQNYNFQIGIVGLNTIGVKLPIDVIKNNTNSTNTKNKRKNKYPNTAQQECDTINRFFQIFSKLKLDKNEYDYPDLMTQLTSLIANNKILLKNGFNSENIDVIYFEFNNGENVKFCRNYHRYDYNSNSYIHKSDLCTFKKNDSFLITIDYVNEKYSFMIKDFQTKKTTVLNKRKVNGVDTKWKSSHYIYFPVIAALGCKCKYNCVKFKIRDCHSM